MNFKGKKALVIDDEEEIRDILVFYLEKIGFLVDSVGSGEEGVDKALANNYLLVITDMKMPGMKGDQVIEKLRENNVTAKLVVSTGSLTTDESRIDGVLFKPFMRDDLYKLLQNLFPE